MMRARFVQLLFALLITVSAGVGQSQMIAPVEVTVLGYHDVRDNLAVNFDPDQFAVTAENLAAHFRWLESQGYQVVSADEILRARAGLAPLPEKAVLLTFDDGFQSVYTHVFPLLKAFGYPAVVSTVTAWIESEERIAYNGQPLSAADFLTWAQMAEMQASGLVEIGSHSHDLHRGIPGNPRGNEQPAAVTLAYGATTYESEATYQARISADLDRSVSLIENHLGVRPRIMTWPYGAWNQIGRKLASERGMVLQLTLDEPAPLGSDGIVARHMLVSNPGVPGFAALFDGQDRTRPVRAAQVDLDYVYDADPLQQERNLGLLLDRIKAMGISHVFLQAFADPDGDGAADALYFPNRRLPVRADLFNRAAWQLRTRAGVSVFAWMPLSAFVAEPDWQVLQTRQSTTAPDPEGEPRLSIFVAEARRFIADIYEDLGRYAPIQGVHFHDDGRLNEFEDTHPKALSAFGATIGRSISAETLHTDSQLEARWARFKSQALTEFSLELSSILALRRPGLKTSRNLFAPALSDPDSERHLAQNYADYLASYDYTTVMAMPHFEGRRNHQRFYVELIDAVVRQPQGLTRTIFQLQTVDWETKQPIDSKALRRTMEFLRARGVDNLAYYPDDFIQGQPALPEMIRGMSLTETPKQGVH